MPGEWHGDDLERRFRAAALMGVTKAIGTVEEEAVRLLLEPPKSGHIYKRRGVEHQASAPGEAPASDTGRLVNSRTKEIDATTLSAMLIFRTEYALMLEIGTVKMEPRPYARRALMDKRTEVLNIIVGELRRLPQ